MIDDAIEEQVAANARAALPTDPVLCYGLSCPMRGQCAHYLAVNGAMGDCTCIPTCLDQLGHNRFPMFIATRKLQ